ncbi:YuzB family protein [Neobacillus dielmonensis]|uniref:YuzB family protein n=1 Tax=Neobacillus dielmonensis TaxID=1347369 RepID=UPI0018A7F99B|nr:YuzB family protein [Neobacillus dielmonensis]
MQIIIEFCVSNLANGAHQAFETLKKDPNLDVIEYGCLSHCGKCARSLYALVDGKVVTGNTPEELVNHIYEYVETHPVF